MGPVRRPLTNLPDDLGGELVISFGVHLRDVRRGMAQHDLCCLEAEFLSNLRPSSVPKPIRCPVFKGLGVRILQFECCVEGIDSTGDRSPVGAGVVLIPRPAATV